MRYYDNKSVLITGGTGGFGQTIAARVLGQGATEIRILSRDESKQHDMRLRFDDPRLSFHLGDVRNPDALTRAFEGVDVVFHAAALKQVPSCEFFPVEAVLTNVLGSHHVIEAARAAGVASLVCLSTDKAVLPKNAMGMTKALMEKVAQAAARTARSGPTVSTVRYGNVVYSRNSVIPHFVDQIFRGVPLTVTDSDMTRFLITLPEAVDLVDYAVEHAQPGDTFIRKAPAAKVGDLATAVNELFGSPVDVRVIGIRHGEKVHETLATADELRTAEDLGDMWRLTMDTRDLNYSDYYEAGRRTDPHKRDDFDSRTAERLDVEGVKQLLVSVPQIRDALERWHDTP